MTAHLYVNGVEVQPCDCGPLDRPDPTSSAPHWSGVEVMAALGRSLYDADTFTVDRNDVEEA